MIVMSARDILNTGFAVSVVAELSMMNLLIKKLILVITLLLVGVGENSYD